MTNYPDLRRAIPADATVSTVQAADGWALRRFDWAAAPKTRGSLMFLGGRGDVFEKYLEAFAHWHAAGWHVTSVDWRGQGGSGRLTANPNVGHASDFAPWIGDLAHVWCAWTAEHAGPHVVVAHSMGGFLTLRALAERVIDPAAAVLVAPMLGLRSPIGARGGEWLARAMAAIGNPARAAWKEGERLGEGGDAGRRRNLTSDAARYADEGWWYDATPAIRLGPPSWGWLAQAFAATRQLEADPALADVTTPVQLLVAEHDRLVDARAAFRLAAKLPHAELVRFGQESAHEILREADAVRDSALAAIDTFLDAHAAPVDSAA